MYKYLQQLILIPIILCMFSYNVFAADSKVSALAELAVTPADTDEMYINDGGTSKKIQYSNVMSGEAATAAALAADPTDCAANQFADVIAANGNLTCSAIVDADIPDDITITNAVYTTDFPLNQDTTGSAASTTGNSATATALAANGANCAADHYALGVDASGAVESCTADANTTYASSDFTLSDIGGSVTDAQVPDDITITLAGTATALAADPANCVTATHFAVGVDAGGVAECEAIADADVPNDITITLAATATASADNPTDCAAGSYPLGVDANWDVANCTDASTEIDSIVATHMAIVGTTSITGHITDTDWDTFNNKVSEATTVSAPLVKTTYDLSIPVATSLADGYLAKADWSTFNGKASLTAPTFATSITGSFLTASEILITDGDKKIVSAAVATYPSLTELSYIKGLSSAVQTQITAKVTGSYATSGEIDTGTEAAKVISPDTFQASKRNIRWLAFNLVEAGTALTTDTNIAGDFVSPIAGTILQSDSTPYYLYATNSTAGINTGTGLVVDIKLGGTSIMTTNKLDFDTTEKTTTTAATPPDLTTTALAVGNIITIDIDSIHDGTAAKGLTVYMAVLEN